MLLQGRTVTSYHSFFFKIPSVHFCCRCLKIGYEPHTKLGHKTNLSRWNSKEIELSLQNIVEKTYKQETTTDLNPKTLLAALKALPTNKNVGKIMFRGFQLHLTLHRLMIVN
jgi:hypothetical protein